MKNEIIFKIRTFPTVSETFVVFNIVAAIKAGFKVTIIADYIDETIQGAQQHFEKKYQLKEKLLVPKPPLNFWKRIISAFSILMNPLMFWYFLKFCKQKGEWTFAHLFTLKFYAPHRKNTIFHVHFANREKPLFDLKKIGFLKSPIIITFHGFDVHKIPDTSEISRQRKDLNNLTTAITVNTNYLKEKALSKGIQETLLNVVPVGFDEGIFQRDSAMDIIAKKESTKENKPILIVSIGRLIALKGHFLGIEAIARAIERGYEIQYIIIGEGPEKEHLTKKISDLNLENCITIEDFKSQHEIQNVLCRAAIFLFPSTTDTTGRQETFGVVSLEAQAMGIPVIGFDCGGFPETLQINKTGFVVEDGNVTQLSQKIIYLIDNPSLRLEMGQQAIKHVQENFNNAKTVSNYIKLYKSC